MGLLVADGSRSRASSLVAANGHKRPPVNGSSRAPPLGHRRAHGL